MPKMSRLCAPAVGERDREEVRPREAAAVNESKSARRRKPKRKKRAATRKRTVMQCTAFVNLLASRPEERDCGCGRRNEITIHRYRERASERQSPSVCNSKQSLACVLALFPFFFLFFFQCGFRYRHVDQTRKIVEKREK